MSLIDLVQQNLGPAEIQTISQQLGVDDATAQQAVQSALPSMVAGMAGQAQNPAGAGSIQSLLGSGGGGLLGSLGGLMGGGGGNAGILGSILGQHQDAVHQHVQQSTGLDSAKTGKLLMILAPIVLSALARRQAQGQQTQGGTAPAINDVLTQEAQHAQQKSPGVGGLLGKILSHVETPRS